MITDKVYDDPELKCCVECGTRSVEYGTCLNCGEPLFCKEVE